MDLHPITPDQKDDYNRVVTHIMQSWEWGEFRQKMGIPVLRYGLFQNNKLLKAFQITLHQIPFTHQFVGYLPKGPLPDKELAEALDHIGKQHKCAFIKVEPDILAGDNPYVVYPAFLPSTKPLFTKHNFLIDLTNSQDQLSQNLHSKARYNIKIAQKKGVTTKVETSDAAFNAYLKLYFETTNRQHFFGHNQTYHRTVWETLRQKDMARLLIAYLPEKKASFSEDELKSSTAKSEADAYYQGKPLTAWLLINFKDTLYYPYGGSTTEHKEVMANNLVAWEAILLGQKMGLKTFDMWGALGPNPDPEDPWIGFHTFKQRYGGKLVEYIGTYDLIFDQTLYFLFTYIDKFTSLKVALLKILGR